MASKRPPIEMDELTDNLKQSSGKGMHAFFPQENPPHPQKEEYKDVQPSVFQEAEAELPTVDVMTSQRYDVNLRTCRDIIEDTETRNSALRLTNDELYAVKDTITQLERRYKVKTSINELARLGLLYLIQDFKKNKHQSLIVEVKKS